MNPAPYLAIVFAGLAKAMNNSISNTELEEIQDIIKKFAVSAAVAGVVAGVVPGVASVAAALAQTGIVWATYVKINKVLGISMKENTAKFIGSAIVTNIVLNAGSLIATYTASAILSLIPIFGQMTSAAINGVVGYVIVYVAAIIYLKLITKLVKPDGSLNISETEDTKKIIADIVKESNLKDMIKEGRGAYKQAKADGSIDAAKNKEVSACPNCHAEVKPGQKFCMDCGTKL